MSAIMQLRPEELKNILLPEFQDRNEPNFAWKSAASILVGLPACRAVWTMGDIHYTAADQVRDISGGGHHLTNNNTVTFGYDRLAPYAEFVRATPTYLNRADGGAGNWADILGTESYIVQPGLTLGCWIYPDDIGNDQHVISKYGASGNRSYLLLAGGNQAGDPAQFFISDDGTNTSAVSSTSGYVAGAWQFIAGRFNDADTGEELAVWLDGEKTTAATARASIFDSTIQFGVGARGSGTASTAYDGKISMVFLCAAALSDALVAQIWQQTRRMFEAS